MILMANLNSQYLEIKDEIDKAVKDVLDSGWFILGPQVEAFEKEFAAYCGAGYGVGVGNGTDAIELALRTHGVGSEDEVITVPNTAIFTVLAISAIGARPVLVDVDPVTYTMDPARLEAAITPRTRAVIPVHLYGQPADMDPILEIARRYKLAVIEDACQAHGALYKGRRVGSLGDAGCFSFYPTKNLGGYGDGGMIVTDDADVAGRLRMLRNGGQRDRYHHVLKGVNSRLDELQAATLRVKLRHLDDWNEARWVRAQKYAGLLKETEMVLPAEADYARHVYHLYVVRSRQRDELLAYLRAHGVGVNIHYPVPVHLQEAYCGLGLGEGDFPIAEQCAREVLSLPMYPEITTETMIRVVDLIHEFCMIYSQAVSKPVAGLASSQLR
jgi:dTDP-4-amino-4,6-dideoxygalactose transaminase